MVWLAPTTNQKKTHGSVSHGWGACVAVAIAGEAVVSPGVAAVEAAAVGVGVGVLDTGVGAWAVVGGCISEALMLG